MVAKLDSQDWRDQYDQLRGQFQGLYAQRMPKLKQYERMVNTTLSDLIGQTMPAAKQYFDQANQLGDFVSEQYTPALGEYLQSARGYDTPERRQEASGRAMSDVMTAGDTARQSALARLEQYGIDPSVTRNASLDANARLQTSLEAVKQGRDAALGVEQRGRAYMSDALDKGEGGARAQMAYGQLGAGIGGSALNAANQVGSTWANIFGTPQQNLEQQRGLISASLDAKSREVASKQAASGGGGGVAGLGSALGTAAGMGLGAFAGSAGGPMGMMMGAQMGGSMGGQLGGMAGSATGGGAQQQQMPPIY